MIHPPYIYIIMVKWCYIS